MIWRGCAYISCGHTGGNIGPLHSTQMKLSRFSYLAAYITAVYAATARRAGPPTVTLDAGTFVGATEGASDVFLGIPFAQPPVGDLRFRLPVANDAYNGTFDATSFGLACPQQALTLPLISGPVAQAIDFIINTIYDIVQPNGEDCLTVNVWTPAGVKPGADLPVVVWIYGGGFEVGASSMYNGSSIIQRSVELDEPAIYVNFNYRYSPFGFLASQEVKDAGLGNIGLWDQRQALKWVQKYIGAFGGDPSKVTIWGESAGAISVALQMLTNGGNAEGLFRGAVMDSGSPIPMGDITHGQQYYDFILEQTDCAGATDTLGCLRQLPYVTLKAAVDRTPNILSFPQALNLAWVPRADGVFFTDTPQNLVLQGSVANIPFINGDCDDEGTFFSLTTLNLTTSDEMSAWFQSNYFPKASDAQIAEVLTTYPDDPTQGSPFDTGDNNALNMEYKRIAAIQGDLIFQAPRRFFLQQRSNLQPTWAFCTKLNKSQPILGSSHGSDTPSFTTPGSMEDYLINFIDKLEPNPNNVTGVFWPQYTNDSPQLLTLWDVPAPFNVTEDNFRVDGMNVLTNLSMEFPL
ncbi:hypothetical protein CERSUDRAFT_150639 [Gelatoporia subvermispora B]|uniref:Carboxylic ester hydrolase n=1 Tax=Ceriporiopsis subvermispora (strain B) TaxID=914234 RepID=M2RM22_CERS8|nr:hypothetical protein CERSUDRAFT_150639 [Gelatoporia subvermispora B]